jgi:hypothetical protein
MICCKLSSLTAVATLGLALVAFDGDPATADNDVLDSNWTVVTMDIKGSVWGVGTSMYANLATGIAFANCKQMSGKKIGCGALIKTVRSGWILALRCGSEVILVAEKDLKDAEDAAIARELELRQVYVPDMPACERLFSVDPRGVVVRENLKTSVRELLTNPRRMKKSAHNP